MANSHCVNLSYERETLKTRRGLWAQVTPVARPYYAY